MRNKKKCFVIMPVSGTTACTEDEWTGIFEQMIRPAVTGSKLGFDCKRAKPGTGNVIKDILNQVNSADVVIADLTDRNPNVFYELGVRHTLKNRTILIAQDMEHVPSDLRGYWVIIYEKNLAGIEDFRKRIREILKEMAKNPEKSDSPVADFLSERNIPLLSYGKSETLKKLTALIAEISYNMPWIERILGTVKESKELEEKKKGAVTASPVRFRNTCLELLLSTSYIMLPQQLLKQIMEVNNKIRVTNSTLDFWRQTDFKKAVEERLDNTLPELKEGLASLLREINKLRVDYVNDNYVEPRMPTIMLSSPEHQKYLEATK
jgi:hypothetical protein